MRFSAPADRVLIRSANWVGDVVMSLPAIRALRARFPHAELAVLAKPWVADLYRHCPEIDEIMIYERDGKHAGIGGLLRLCTELKARRFDVGVSIQNAFEAALILWLSRIPVRIGYAADGRSLLLTHRVARTPSIRRLHQVDYYLKLLEGVGIPTCGRDIRLVLSEAERRWATEQLAQWGISGRQMLCGINPGAAFGTAKRWPRDRWIALSKRLLAGGIGSVLVFGSPSESGLGESIAAAVGVGCISLCGKTDLRQAMALISACNLFVTNDSGLMHVSAGLDVPLVAIFGPTRHDQTSPLSAKARLIRVPVACGPCMKPHCPTDHRCMTAVTVDLVWREAMALLEGARP
ncbi:lipopolysaccharide heptosyltransferase II [Desulfatirhabdium butyrativorans]|uniref:lipopolysaccharide heptosyltransferase II n=1 Tax=Desulfatirhabdium butyrativorans TaxID=340467 RepID=UPI00040F105A|nr:lipopolysaccharide heptosyltransferase II [Desulfatirhabdium butyrativorans]